MKTIHVENKHNGIQYLVGTVGEDGEFWSQYETPLKKTALQKAAEENRALVNKTRLIQRWTVVKQTTTFEEVTE